MKQSMGNRSITFDKRFCWRYDDKTYQTVKRKGKKVIEKKLIRKEKLDDLEKDGVHFRKIKVKNYIQNNMTKKEESQAREKMQGASKVGFHALENMLQDYSLGGSAQEILRLFSMLLLGYTNKIFHKYATGHLLQCSRAPIVLVKQHKTDGCGGFEHLAHFVESIAVDTSVNELLQHHNPAVLPEEYCTSTLIESAYMQVSELSKKEKFPAVYRNTAVLVHANFFSGTDIRDFIRRNVWATVAVFGQKSLSKEGSACMHIDLNKMGLTQRNCDELCSIEEKEQIHDLMEAFVAWLAILRQKKKYRKSSVIYWLDIGHQSVRKYHLAIASTKLPIMQGSERQYAVYQVAALRAFLDFCADMELVEDDVLEDTWNQWCNELLPGSRIVEVYRKQEAKKQQATEDRHEALLNSYEKLLKCFVEDATNSMITLKQDVDWESYNLEERFSNRPCVFMWHMRPTSANIESFLAVAILKKDLMTYSAEHGDEYGEAISYVWSKNMKKENLRPYIHTNQNVTLKKGLSPNGVVLKLDQLSFLDADTQHRLHKLISKN